MADSNPYSAPVLSSPIPLRSSVLFGGLAAAVATLVAIVAVVMTGVIAWELVVGVKGALFAGMLGGALGLALLRHGHWLPRALGGILGSAVGGYFVIAAAEQAVPGSSTWAVRGGLLGTAFGIPTAVLVASTAGMVVQLTRRD
jgi:hypothetical protein